MEIRYSRLDAACAGRLAPKRLRVLNSPSARRPRRASVGWALVLACGMAMLGQPLAVGGVPATAAPVVRVVAEHPRLFLRAGDLPALRARCAADPVVKEAYGLVRKFAYSEARNPNLWVTPDEFSTVLVAYLVENRDPKLLDRARGYLQFLAQAQGDEWTRPRILKALAHAYDWLHGELTAAERQKLAGQMRTLVAEMRRAYRHSDYNNHVYLQYGPLVYPGLALAGDGVDDALAEDCLRQARTLLEDHFLPAVNQVAGQGDGGWHESMSYWSFFAYELAHQMEAWRTAAGQDLFARCPGLRGAARWLVYCTQPYDNSMAPVGDIDTPARWGWEETALMPLLAARYRDGLAQHVALRVRPEHPARAWPFVLWFDPKLPPSDPAKLPTGTLFSGLGWAAMRSAWDGDATWALFVCGDYYAGHQHSDQNSLIIGCRGPLAIDAGQYGAKATEFHNTLLVGGPQRLFGNDPRQRVAPTPPQSPWDTGDILAFEENPHFTYVVGDASNAYAEFRNGKRLEPAPLCVRRVLFFKPDLFVVDDLAALGSRQGPLRWLLHAEQKPQVGGRQVMLDNGKARLAVLPLLPERAEIQVSPQSGGRRKLAHWRIDIAPAEPALRAHFLHVLAVQRGGQEDLPQCRLTRAAGHVELQIAAGTRRYTVWLPEEAQGPAYLEVAASDGTALVARRLLPAGILPYAPESIGLLERWDRAYRGGQVPGWDVGRPDSILREVVQAKIITPGRTVELGCGTGTNAVYLAQQGFEVSAIDIAPTALALAEKKAAAAGVKVRWLLADVLSPPRLEPADFIFDRGCYHGVRQSNAAGYVAALARLSRPGTRVLILAGNANELRSGGPPRVAEEQLRKDFSADFEFEWLKTTRFDTRQADRAGALAWALLLRRK